jgi:hypothetical protein
MCWCAGRGQLKKRHALSLRNCPQSLSVLSPTVSMYSCVVSWPDWLWRCGSSLIGYEPRSEILAGGANENALLSRSQWHGHSVYQIPFSAPYTHLRHDNIMRLVSHIILAVSLVQWRQCKCLCFTRAIIVSSHDHTCIHQLNVCTEFLSIANNSAIYKI